MLKDLWRFFFIGPLSTALWGVVCFGVLAIAYRKAKRWDPTWKEGWERRHAAPLEVLRSKVQRTLKVGLIMRWIFLALFFMSVGLSLEPIFNAIELQKPRPALLIELANLNLILLILVGLAEGGIRLLRYRIGRINELLAAEPRH